MKRLLIALFLALSVSATAQINVDSIRVYTPDTTAQYIKTLYKGQNLEENLNKLNEKYKTDEFILIKYDGYDAYRCKIRAIREDDFPRITV